MSEAYRTETHPPAWPLRLVFLFLALLLSAIIASVVKDLLPGTLDDRVRYFLPAVVLAVVLYAGQEWMFRAITVRHVPVCPHCGLDLDSPARICRHCGADTWAA